MTLDKAIEILDLNVRQRSPQMPPDVKDALKLSIEALKLIEVQRFHKELGMYSFLPGETEE